MDILRSLGIILQMITKGDLKAIYNTTDIVSGGLLTTIKNSLVNTYSGYFEDKFNGLIKDLLNNEIEEQEILNWINNLGDIDKDIYFSIINKNLLSETKIKRFLLSKILFYKIKNQKLDYFHSNLLTNIDLFIEDDFSNFNTIGQNYQKNEVDKNEESIKINTDNFSSLDYKITISKLQSVGILTSETYVQNWSEKGYIYIGKSNGFDKLDEYIKEYFSFNSEEYKV